MAHGFVTATTGTLQWFEKEPGFFSNIFQGGDVLVDNANFSGAHLQGWRCPGCRLILISY